MNFPCYLLIKSCTLWAHSGGMCLQRTDGWHHSLTVVLNSVSSAENFSPLISLTGLLWGHHPHLTSEWSPDVCSVILPRTFPSLFTRAVSPSYSQRICDSRAGCHDIIAIAILVVWVWDPNGNICHGNGVAAADRGWRLYHRKSQVCYWTPLVGRKEAMIWGKVPVQISCLLTVWMLI